MSTELPDTIRRFVEAHKPPTHDLAWLRCSYMDAEEIERPPRVSGLLWGRRGEIPRDTHLQVKDIETDEGWGVRIEDTGHDIHPGDLFSLIGHAPKGADRLAEPAVLLNHNTGRFWRCYRDTGGAGLNLLTELDHKKTLAFRSPSSVQSRLDGLRYTAAGWFTAPLTPARDRRRNIVLAAGLGLYLWAASWFFGGGGALEVARQTYQHPWLLVVWLPLAALLVGLNVGLALLGFAVAAAWLVFLGGRIARAVMEPPRFKDGQEYTFAQMVGWSNVTDWLRFVYVDQTYVYQETVKRLQIYVLANPDEETGFVVDQVRGLGEKGFLPAAAPPNLPKAA